MWTQEAADSARCPVCRGTGLVDLYEASDPRFPSPERFHVMWCGRCAVASTQPALSPAELSKYYPDDYDPYREGAAERAHSRLHRALLRVEERFGPAATDDLPLGSLLDVGCGNGEYMAGMARRGFTVSGVEISPRAAQLVAARGLRVTTGDFLAANLPADRFDIVTMNHYLEHALDPRASLNKAHALLRTGGRLVVGVPNFSSWERERFGPYWSDLEVPRHVSHFTPEGLVRLLAECGFRSYRVRYVASSDAGSIVTSWTVGAGKQGDPLARRMFPFLHLVLYPIGVPLMALRRSAWIRVFALRA